MVLKRKTVIGRPRLSNLLHLTVRHFPSYIEKDANHPPGQKSILCVLQERKNSERRI